MKPAEGLPVSKAKQAKFAKVEALAKELESSKSVAILDMNGMPTNIISQLRKALRGQAVIKMTTRTVIKFALDKTAKKELNTVLCDQPALLFANGDWNSFKIYRILVNSKSPAPARAGKITPIDIVIPKGDTGLPPGPVVGDLQKAGLPAKIQSGKIVIDKEVTVAKAGEAVKKEVAEALIKLGIEPFEIKLNVTGFWQDGLLLKREILDIAADTGKARSDLSRAASQALSVALECAYPTKETIVPLLGRAGGESRSLAREAGIVTKENVGDMLAFANAQASALASRVKIEPK